MRQRRRCGLRHRGLRGAGTPGAVSLEVRVSNWGAQRLYGRVGFHPVGVRKNYYQELQEDALIMWTDDVRTREYARRLERVAAELPEGVRPA